MPRTRVVITGIGAVSPNGVGAEAFASACIEGRSGLRKLPWSEQPGLRSTVAGIVDFDPSQVMSPVDLRRVPRLVPMALLASREAQAMSGAAAGEGDTTAQRQMGVILGSGGGGLSFVEEQYRGMFSGGSPSVFSITAGTHGNLSSELSIALSLRGPSHVISTGCTSSTDALGYAAMLIRAGAAKMLLAGGADAPIAPGILQAFERMKVISTRQDEPARCSRPFSMDRDGFVLGEGAWMFTVEAIESAQQRGAIILAEIAGYVSTCDAYHRVQIAPDVAEPVRAMSEAMEQAGVGPDDVDYINLHGTGTELNDRLETLAVHRCFGERARRIPCSATKSLIGHPQGACGAAGIAATVLCARRGWIHPTINLDRPDPECDLDYVPLVARRATVRVAVCNCIAFGSKNSALVLRIPAASG